MKCLKPAPAQFLLFRCAGALMAVLCATGCTDSASSQGSVQDASALGDAAVFVAADATADATTDGSVWLDPIDAAGDLGPKPDRLDGDDGELTDGGGESGSADAGGDALQGAPDVAVPPAVERAWPDGFRKGIGWPTPNEHSWDGSVTFPADAFPLAEMIDDEYGDGHLTWWGDPSPILPPGAWDWNDSEDDLANWRNFEENIGRFAPLWDSNGGHYGWRLVSHLPQSTAYSGPSHYYEGSTGADVLSLGPQGAIHSFEIGDLGDGPDLLVFNRAWSLDFRTGGVRSNPATDNDLVVGGCTVEKTPGYDFETATVHTGPGADWIFARDMRAAAIDAGNGANGDTS